MPPWSPASPTPSFVVERTIEENVHRLCQQRAAAMDLSAASSEGPAFALEVLDIPVNHRNLSIAQGPVEGLAGGGAGGGWRSRRSCLLPLPQLLQLPPLLVATCANTR